MLFRFAAIVLLAATSATAQFFSLTTAADGSRLYFATPLRQKTTPQPDYGKLFRIEANRLTLQESRIQVPPEPVPPGIGGFGMFHVGSAYDLQSVDVSSDGQVLAAAAARDCSGDPTFCAKLAELYLTTITTSGHSQDFPGRLRLSANGKWAFGGGSGTPHYSNFFAYVLNVSTGEQISLSSNGVTSFHVSNSGRSIANNGTAVFSEDRAVTVVEGAQIRRIPTESGDQADGAVIDAAGRMIVYSVATNPIPPEGGSSLARIWSLHLTDLASSRNASLAQEGYAPSLSDDGLSVLYLSQRDGKPQVWLVHSDGSSNREVSHDPLGITQAILSGDGSTAYATTLGGRLIEITVATGAIQELVPRTPFIDQTEIAPGRLISLQGEGLSDSSATATAPLPYSLNGIQITIQDQATRIFSVEPTVITVFTPPNITVPSTPQRLVTLKLETDSPSPFATPLVPVSVTPYWPAFVLAAVRAGIPYLLAAHQDWSAIVSVGLPARPGEILHAYALGLGPTTPDVPYGEAAPAQEPLARLTAAFRCSYNINNTEHEIEVLFQGLAPNLVGIYQIDWRVPTDAPDGDLVPNCIAANGFSLFGSVPVRH